MTETDEFFPALNDAKWFVVVGMGSIAMRFGPISKDEVGKAMERALAENIAMNFIADCGPKIDWAVAREFICTPVKVSQPAADDTAA